MQSFQDFLNGETLIHESLNTKPVAWSLVKDSDIDAVYRFTIEQRVYAVFFKIPIQSSKPVVVDFGMLNPKTNDIEFTMSNSGNQYQVLMTVLDTIKDFMARKDPVGITLTARKGMTDKDSKSRASVYGRMIHKFMPKTWSVSVSDTGHEIRYTIMKQ